MELSRNYGTFFAPSGIYCPGYFLRGGMYMDKRGNTSEDLDDLIFDEDDGGPSER